MSTDSIWVKNVRMRTWNWSLEGRLQAVDQSGPSLHILHQQEKMLFFVSGRCFTMFYLHIFFHDLGYASCWVQTLLRPMVTWKSDHFWTWKMTAGSQGWTSTATNMQEPKTGHAGVFFSRSTWLNPTTLYSGGSWGPKINIWKFEDIDVALSTETKKWIWLDLYVKLQHFFQIGEPTSKSTSCDVSWQDSCCVLQGSDSAFTTQELVPSWGFGMLLVSWTWHAFGSLHHSKVGVFTV